MELELLKALDVLVLTSQLPHINYQIESSAWVLLKYFDSNASARKSTLNILITLKCSAPFLSDSGC